MKTPNKQILPNLLNWVWIIGLFLSGYCLAYFSLSPHSGNASYLITSESENELITKYKQRHQQRRQQTEQLPKLELFLINNLNI